MGFHRTGKAVMVSDEGKIFHYDIEAWGAHMEFRDTERVYSFIEDKPQILIKEVEKQIEDLKHEIKLKRDILTQLKEKELK